MKKTAYLSGLISCNATIFGVMFKMMHWPGAGILLTVGVFLTVFVFLPLALLSNYTTLTNKPGKLLYLVTYITCLLIFVSALFKIMHWPGSAVLLTVSIPFPFVVFLPVFLYYSRKEEYLTMGQTVVVVLFMAYFSVMTAMMALNISKSVIDQSIAVSHRFMDLNKRIAEQSEAEAKIFGVDKMTREGKEVYVLINKIKSDIVKHTGYEGVDDVSIENITIYDLPAKDSNEPVQSGMFQDKAYADTLKKAFETYHRFLQSQISDNEELLKELTDDYFSVSDVDFNGNKYPWEKFYFGNVNTIWALSNLTQFQTNILFTESELLNSKLFAELQ